MTVYFYNKINGLTLKANTFIPKINKLNDSKYIDHGWYLLGTVHILPIKSPERGRGFKNDWLRGMRFTIKHTIAGYMSVVGYWLLTSWCKLYGFYGLDEIFKGTGGSLLENILEIDFLVVSDRGDRYLSDAFGPMKKMFLTEVITGWRSALSE